MSELCISSGRDDWQKEAGIQSRLEYILEDSKSKRNNSIQKREIGTEHMLIALIHDIDCVATRF